MTIKEPYKLIQNIVDASSDLILILEGDEPIYMNTTLCEFFGVKDFFQYQEGFGPFIKNFVPHPRYFHGEKLEEGESWTEVLSQFDDRERVVSMINRASEPRAFRVDINTAHEFYTIVYLHDISADLIKSIMIENDVSIDKNSGAYNRDYFYHTAEILQDGAHYNEKEIGLCMISLLEDKPFGEIVSDLKQVSREDDMLIKFSFTQLLIAFLVENRDKAEVFSKKLQKNIPIRHSIAYTIVKQNEKIQAATKRLTIELNPYELKFV